MSIKDTLSSLTLEHDGDLSGTLGAPCCLRGRKMVQCQDCFQYELSCAECFIDRHQTNPWHWARVWTPFTENHGFFRRQDISTLRPEGYAYPLGHNGQRCPNSKNAVHFIVTHSNGIHATLLSFCQCSKSGDRVHQLMRARLFPATTKEVISAFTFSVLKEYDLLSLQAKFGAQDFIVAMRRLTDNAFTSLVNVRFL
jgi:hypothetical protein